MAFARGAAARGARPGSEDPGRFRLEERLLSESDALVAQIRQAFAGRQPPAIDALALRPEMGCPPAGRELARRFGGRSWPLLEFDDIADDSESPALGTLSYMTAEAVAAYLAAYLLAAVAIADKGRSANDAEDAFVDSLCFFLRAPSPIALQEQYTMVRDLPEVPDEIKEALRNPGELALETQRMIVERHARLRAILSAEEREAVRATLERLAGFLAASPPPDRYDGDNYDGDRFNSAVLALGSGWSADAE